MHPFLDKLSRSGFLLFAGAGCSAPPPSSLPNWHQLNEAILQALATRAGEYSKQRYGQSAVEGLLAARGSQPFFAPDYQAQLIEEEIGVEYFQVFRALETAVPNAVHHAAAALAGEGTLRAIVTTNFDQLFERALEARGVRYNVFATPASYDRLPCDLHQPGAPVPLIKVHGTLEEPSSMVDTLRQRLQGRPESLNRALAALYRDLPVLFAGFSGADLEYDPEYLGLRAAAAANSGFLYLSRSGTEPRAAIRDLCAAWGENAGIISAELPGWLVDLCRQRNLALPEPEDVPPGASLAAVGEAADRWAVSLGDIQTVNIIAALLSASGSEQQALEFLRKVWRMYRSPHDQNKPAYWRFQYHLGKGLLERGVLSYESPVAAVERGEKPADDAFQFLSRASSQGNIADANPDLALCLAYRGNVADAHKLLGSFLEHVVELRHPRLYVDTAIAGGLVWSMAGDWSAGLEHLEVARQIARKYGDDVRRARLAPHLVRFYTWKQNYDAGEQILQEGERLSARLGLPDVAARTETERGHWLAEQGRFTEAVEAFSRPLGFFASSERTPDLVRLLLDRVPAAYHAGDGAALNESLNSLLPLLEEIRGYIPHFHLALARVHIWNSDQEEARDSLREAHAAANQFANPYIHLIANELESVVHSARQGPE